MDGPEAAGIFISMLDIATLELERPAAALLADFFSSFTLKNRIQ